MALTLRMNGSGQSNIVTSDWWNDYYKLLTGQMNDQPVTVAANVTIQGVMTTPTTTPQTVLNSGGSMAVGTYKYVYTYVMADGGETLASPSATATTTTGNQAVTFQNLLPGPTGTTKRNIYRTQVGGSTYYFLAALNDNTTSYYYDNNLDSALNTAISPPAHSTFGGALIIKDATGATNLTITPDGSIIGASNSTTLGPTTVNGNLTVNSGTTYLANTNAYGLLQTMSGADIKSAGNLYMAGGKLGKSAAGDVIDASGSIVYFKAGTQFSFQIPNSTTIASLSASLMDFKNLQLNAGNIHAANGLNLDAGTFNVFQGATMNASQLTINMNGGTIAGTGIIFSNGVQLNGALLLQPGNTATPSAIVSGNAGIGIKMNNGTQLFEIKSTGAAILRGALTQSSTAFDSFDIAECYYVDQVYPFGTVLCSSNDTMPIPADQSAYNPTLTKCTHDGCNACSVVSQSPANIMGMPNVPGTDNYDSTQPLAQPMALAGRIYIKTAYDIPARTYVCSDGRGGVRAVASGEKVFAIGVSLGPSSQGLVPVTLRSVFVSL